MYHGLAKTQYIPSVRQRRRRGIVIILIQNSTDYVIVVVVVFNCGTMVVIAAAAAAGRRRRWGPSKGILGGHKECWCWMKRVCEGGIDMARIAESVVRKNKKTTEGGGGGWGGGTKREKGWRCPKIGEVKGGEWRCERESRHHRCVHHHQSQIL